MNYKFVELDTDAMMTHIDDMIGIACSLNSQNYETLMKMRKELKNNLEGIFRIDNKAK